MLKDGKLLRDGNKYQFNEHYENWKTVRNTDTYRQENLHPLSEKLTPTVSNTDTPDMQESLIAKAPVGKNALRKDTLKILNNKDTLKISTVEAHPKIIFNNRTFKFENIPKEKIEKWKEAFLNCSVDIELKKMEAWLAANPERLKKNYEKFIVNWLSRTHPELISGAKGEENGKNKGNNGRYIPITGKRKFTGLNANAGEW